ncbi:DUF2975 family protein [Muricomes intestini]|jgi:hypothetical protein|uniref:DUF2975 family protein n=2 Tax=Muricomes intestini TaxID=1796634 RepID=A0A4R3KA72_9FIRM|nr:DUF2975 domain-containing protein [Muricomes intestini]TCS79541.1 DUF2975 family protein [Muricomes intestini]
MSQEKLIRFTNLLLGFMFYSGIVVILGLPFILKIAGKYFSPAITEEFWPILIIYGLAGICGVTILNQLRKMIKTVMDKNCFVDNNVQSLKLMGKVSLTISILFIIELFFLPTPVTFVIILTFFIAGIFSHVLACVFEEAVRYKKENDLTI